MAHQSSLVRVVMVGCLGMVLALVGPRSTMAQSNVTIVSIEGATTT